eukprot:CAMPEP_0178564410 /NCGR_PEP_ID=MMETSP0697-20121206/13612_1 /TAXON_ID=265572 /ORGANISM="Extubocellulus spinifer, Strain CCMP396" /LENGTH=75 /DNA_ID=CAMNT_0020197945 /DNA_START=783 /DNA_END=1008 /DNA_ORIENTATION=+
MMMDNVDAAEDGGGEDETDGEEEFIGGLVAGIYEEDLDENELEEALDLYEAEGKMLDHTKVRAAVHDEMCISKHW